MKIDRFCSNPRKLRKTEYFSFDLGSWTLLLGLGKDCSYHCKGMVEAVSSLIIFGLSLYVERHLPKERYILLSFLENGIYSQGEILSRKDKVFSLAVFLV